PRHYQEECGARQIPGGGFVSIPGMTRRRGLGARVRGADEIKSLRAAWPLLSSRAVSAIEAPARASPRAMARPRPPLPPVTIATRPVRSKGFKGDSESRSGEVGSPRGADWPSKASLQVIGNAVAKSRRSVRPAFRRSGPRHLHGQSRRALSHRGADAHSAALGFAAMDLLRARIQRTASRRVGPILHWGGFSPRADRAPRRAT